MYIICAEKRWEYWNHFVARWTVEGIGGGSGVTGDRLRKVRQVLFDDDEFWLDVVGRHNGRNQTPESLQMCELDVYDHCLGNFWGMVYQTLVERGLIG